MSIRSLFGILIFTISAQAQTTLKYDFYDSATENLYNAKPKQIHFESCWLCLGSAPEPVEINLLKLPVKVTIPKGTQVFNHPNYVKDPTQVPGYFSGYQGSSQCDLSKNTSAKLLHINQDYAAVQLLPGSDCSAVSAGAGQPKIIFVNTKSVRDPDEFTEAGLTIEDDCEDCKNSPAGLDKIDVAAIENSQDDPNGTDYALNILGNDSPDKLDTFKSREDQEHYLGCWTTDNNRDAYINGYKQLIEKAGDTFQISYDPTYNKIFAFDKPSDFQNAERQGYLVRANPNVVKCLMLIESGFDKTKVSGTGAVGIAQLTSTNVKEVNCLIGGCKLKGSKSRKPAPWAQKRWNAYIKNVKRDFPPDQYPHIYQNKDGNMCPDKIKNDNLDSTCPILSIAATAIYQLKIELGVRGVAENIIADDSNTISEVDQDSLSLAVASTHNGGETLTRKAAAKSSKISEILTRMIKTTDREDEVEGYIKKVRTCLSDKKFSPPWSSPSKADLKKAKACAASAPSKKGS